LKLIVGLGNPGRGYAHNRHNIGFRCLSHFAQSQGIRFDRKQGKARIGLGEVAGGVVVLARPQTFMNLSGDSVSRLVKKFNIGLDDLIVIHDDLDLSLGKIRIRFGGSAGGHKGVDSIISSLGSRDFPRLRAGIGRPVSPENSVKDGETVINYVLSDFTFEEEPVVAGVIIKASQAILGILREGLSPAMNEYN